MLVRGQDVVRICERHRKNAVPIYSHCVGCEIEGLRESESALRARVARMEELLRIAANNAHDSGEEDSFEDEINAALEEK